MDDRRFTDREVREILKRAVEKSPSRALAKGDGVSLAELKAIGAEVGIDAGRLEEAARSVALDHGNRTNAFLGGPSSISFERTVPGELTPEDTPEVLATIRRTMRQQGEAEVIHGSLEWNAKGEIGSRHVTLSSKDGTTTISGATNLTNLAIVTYLPASILGVALTVAGLVTFEEGGTGLGLGLFFGTLPVLYGIMRTIFSKVSGAEARKLEQAVEDVARLPKPTAD